MAKRINRDELDRFHDYGIYVPTRTIYIGTESTTESDEMGVDAVLAERVIKNLLILDTQSQEPITIIINNVGGDEAHGLAIFDAVRSCKSDVTAIVFGQAMSMGSIIFQAASKRIMSPRARQMIHYGTWGFDGHAKTAQQWAKEGEKMDMWMENMYLEKIREKHPKFSLSQLRKMLDHDTFLSAEESVALGLADEILGEKE